MSELDYPEIRSRISIRHVLELLCFQPVIRRGPQWRGPCPICSSSTGAVPQRCFSVHVDRNIFQCFRCRRSGNQLDLWVHISGLPLRAATLDLCRQLHITPLTTRNPQPPSRH